MFESFTITQILSVFIGLYLLSVGVGFVLERNKVQTMMQQFSDNMALGFISGVVALIIGATIISLHQDFSNSHAIVVSVIGWTTLIKGVVILAFRELFMRVINCALGSSKIVCIIGIAAILAGVWMMSAI